MTTLTKPDVVRARIETKVKRDAEIILRRLGVSHSTFINMSYRAVIANGGIPLSLRVPNKETARVLRDAKSLPSGRPIQRHPRLRSFTPHLRPRRSVRPCGELNLAQLLRKIINA